ncbi:hypothetical protein [Aneurinibacillus aneurinilyticus]|uniref:hypothetical protein n=1 Tax=Aneurinibacillus aneurinilyticus TaxID=1391 RepID=UPI0035269B4E
MKTTKFLAILIILLLFLTACTKSEKQTEDAFTIKMSGESEHWRIENYVSKITDTKSEFGNGKIYYIGQEKLKQNTAINFFSIEFRLGNEKVVYRKSITADTIDFPQDLKDADLTQNITLDEKSHFDRDIVEKTYAIVKWSVSNGEEHTEKINLHKINDIDGIKDVDYPV